MERTPQLRQGTINNGDIVVRGGAHVAVRPDDPNQDEGIMAMGTDIFVNGETGMQHIITRSRTVPGSSPLIGGVPPFTDGQVALRVVSVDGSTVDPTIAFHTIELNDKTGQPFVSDSLSARQGMDHPRLSYTWYDTTAFKSTTSGTFAQVATTQWYSYHPHLRIGLLVQNDGGTTSEYQVWDETDNFQVATGSAGSGFFGYVLILVRRSSTLSGQGPNGNNTQLRIDHRRASGAGTSRSMISEVTGIDLSWFNPF